MMQSCIVATFVNVTGTQRRKEISSGLQILGNNNRDFFGPEKVLAHRTGTNSKNDGPTNKIGRPGCRAMLFV